VWTLVWVTSEILNHLETVTDRLESVADEICAPVIKHLYPARFRD